MSDFDHLLGIIRRMSPIAWTEGLLGGALLVVMAICIFGGPTQ